jgi:hypothetical protein
MAGRRAAAGRETAGDFRAVFIELRKILEPYAPKMRVTEDTPARYTLIAGYSERLEKDIWFASTVVHKSYVSFYLMPIYMNAPLQASVSVALKRHMQGKACFNFKSLEPELFGELKALTKKGCADFRKLGYTS